MADSTRRVLITGANKGIGLATARALLAAAEDTFVLLGSRDADRGEAARRSLAAEHPGWAERVVALTLDVTSDDSVAAAAEWVDERFGAGTRPLFGIVNNAGIGLGSHAMADVLAVNVLGPHRVCEAFSTRLRTPGGRIVNVASASGPMFVAGCSPSRRRELTRPDVTWDDIVALMNECRQLSENAGDFAAAGLGREDAYGLSKACLNAYTIELARRFPELVINSCTPGFIETDLTRPYAERSGKTPVQLGMKSPAEGTKATLHLLLGDAEGSGWYFGSDAQRSPLDRYRSPGDPPYTGD